MCQPDLRNLLPKVYSISWLNVVHYVIYEAGIWPYVKYKKASSVTKIIFESFVAGTKEWLF